VNQGAEADFRSRCRLPELLSFLNSLSHESKHKAAGTHRDIVHMKTADFRHLSQPVIGDFIGPTSASKMSPLAFNAAPSDATRVRYDANW
jgi:hypothetical protein